MSAKAPISPPVKNPKPTPPPAPPEKVEQLRQKISPTPSASVSNSEPSTPDSLTTSGMTADDPTVPKQWPRFRKGEEVSIKGFIFEITELDLTYGGMFLMPVRPSRRLQEAAERHLKKLAKAQRKLQRKR